jgi:ribosomal-protein-alanine N-acetyltransferase
LGKLNLCIRDAAAEDLATLVDLHALAFDEAWSGDAIAGVLFGLGAIALVAQADDRAAGFVLGRTAADECEILTLAVLPAMRRQGIARALVEELSVRSVAAGAETMFLEVAEDNAAAGGLYAGLGFTAVGRRPGYYQRRGQSDMAALVLRRSLGFFQP